LKKLLLASAAVVAGGTAFAADLPVKAPLPARVAPFSWTSCHIGAHVGGGWARSTEFSDPIGANIAPVGSIIQVDNDAGLVGGAQVGCDYQFATNWVIGVAGDFSWADIDGQTNDPFFAGKTIGVPLTLHSRTNFLASATGRIGYAWDNVLLYGKGGVAWSHNKYQVTNFACAFLVSCSTGADETRMGWTAGAGVEWAFSPNWSVFAEYNHYGFGGARSLTFTDPAVTSVVFNVETPDIDVVKVGINFRFGGLFR
jgi:outer membrane immunogenic protein